MAHEPIMIIGSGLAGYTVAREVRRLDPDVRLHIVTADDGAFYSKPMLSNAMSAGKNAGDLVVQSAEAMRRQLSATIDTDALVKAIDPAARRIEVGNSNHAYRHLVLAVGADPVRLSMEGNAADAVLSINNLRDYETLQQRLAGKKRVAILGAGLIGSEFANDLCLAGFSVQLIDTACAPMTKLLPPEAALRLRARLETAGVAFRATSSCLSVDAHADGYRLWLDDNTALDTDVVISAVGLRPNTSLARAAGLTVRTGIVVDEWLQTSAPSIFALGDCAEICNLILPYVAPITYAAKALASTLMGRRTAVQYPAMPIILKTPAWPVVVAPLHVADGGWRFDGDESSSRGLYENCDRLLRGFVLEGSAVKERRALAQRLPAQLCSQEMNHAA